MINLANNLSLQRPLAVMDLETTGLDPDKDRICQIAVTIHYTDKDPIPWVSLINPECPIRKEAADAHGITDEQVQESPTFRQIAPSLGPHLLGADIMGYNVVFDIDFFRAEMKRANYPWDWKGYTIDAYQIYRRMMPHNLEAAYLEFGGESGEPLPTGTTLEGAHDAGVDVSATEAVLRGQLLRFRDELPRTVKELAAFCFPPVEGAIDESGGRPNWKPKFIWKDDVPCINFGKYARNGPYPMRKVPRDYYEFILSKDFSPSAKALARDALRGVYPTRDQQLPMEEEEPF